MKESRPLLILASASPRREKILRDAGFLFHTFPVKVSETLRKNLSIDEQIISIAKEKAEAALEQYKPLESQDYFILTADTEVIWGGQALGKPLDQSHACQILKQLSGNEHIVITALCLLKCKSENDQVTVVQELTATETTHITFKKLSDHRILEYVQSGEPMDKAGAYGIQGAASDFIEKMNGPLDNVVGLPMGLLQKLLNQIGF